MRILNPVRNTLKSSARYVVFLLLGAATAIQAAAADDTVDVRNAQPNAALSPEAVVQIQMDALGSNNSWGNDAGIAVAFRFASPANRRMTGPLERFVNLVKNPLYAPMLDHNSIEFAPSRDRDGQAWVPVRLTGADGSKAGYLFILGRQDGSPCNCWMTESVQRIPLGDSDNAPRGSAI